jgi:hypothetical protein
MLAIIRLMPSALKLPAVSANYLKKVNITQTLNPVAQESRIPKIEPENGETVKK